MLIRSNYYGNVVFFKCEGGINAVSRIPEDYNKEEDTELSIQETVDNVAERIWYGLEETYEDYHNDDDLQWRIIPYINKQQAIAGLVIGLTDPLTIPFRDNIVRDIKTVNNTNLNDYNVLLESLGYDIDEFHQMIKGA